MSLPRWISAASALLVVACHGSTTGGTAVDAGPVCVASATSEASCDDGRDDDCDGFVDCLDTECGGQTCGEAGETCQSGGCLCPTCPLPALPALDNLRVTMHGD